MDKNEVAKLAFELFVNSGCEEGRDLDNWIEAEKILAARENVLLKTDVDFEITEMEHEEKEMEAEESAVIL